MKRPLTRNRRPKPTQLFHDVHHSKETGRFPETKGHSDMPGEGWKRRTPSTVSRKWPSDSVVLHRTRVSAAFRVVQKRDDFFQRLVEPVDQLADTFDEALNDGITALRGGRISIIPVSAV